VPHIARKITRLFSLLAYGVSRSGARRHLRASRHHHQTRVTNIVRHARVIDACRSTRVAHTARHHLDSAPRVTATCGATGDVAVRVTSLNGMGKRGGGGSVAISKIA